MKNLLAMLALLTGLLVSPQSKAFVGLASDDDNIALLGLALMDISTITVVERRHTHYRRGYRRTFYTTYRVLTFPAFLIAGLVLLDDQGTATISDEISEEVANVAGLSPQEKSAIENNAEEITAIKDSIIADTASIADRAARAEQAGNLWLEYGSQLPKEALLGLHKMATVK